MLRASWLRGVKEDSPDVAQMLPCLVGVIIQYKTRESGALCESNIAPTCATLTCLRLVFGYYILGSYVASLGICFAAPGANIAGTT
jgi:ACS family allantoate permease-like MFS transporter